MTKKSMLETYRTHWQWYRDFFSVGILRYFVLWFSMVPLVVHSLGALPAVIPAKVGSVVVIFKPELPFNWVLLWVASVCYTSALFIFAARCPDFIKKYPSFRQYKDHGHSSRWIVWLAYDVSKEGKKTWEKLKKRLHEKGYATDLHPSLELRQGVIVGKQETSFQFDDGGRRYELAMPVVDSSGAIMQLQTEVAEQEIFWEVFGAQSGSRKLSRVAIIVLLLFALLLFLVVLIQHVWAAVPYAVEELVSLILPIKLAISVWFVPA